MRPSGTDRGGGLLIEKRSNHIGRVDCLTSSLLVRKWKSDPKTESYSHRRETKNWGSAGSMTTICCKDILAARNRGTSCVKSGWVESPSSIGATKLSEAEKGRGKKQNHTQVWQSDWRSLDDEDKDPQALKCGRVGNDGKKRRVKNRHLSRHRGEQRASPSSIVERSGSFSACRCVGQKIVRREGNS